MECLRGTSADVVGAEYGYAVRILFHPEQRDMFGDIYAGLGGSCKFCH